MVKVPYSLQHEIFSQDLVTYVKINTYISLVCKFVCLQ